jgi:hypothetical protein
MSYEIQVLRAMLRLARRREVADEAALLVRVGGTAAAIRTALRRLEKELLVERLDAGRARLTMNGFAIAVATAKLSSTRAARVVAEPTVKPKRVVRARRRVRAA